ncbi:MAG: hypothetical protein KDA05_03655 [Phycisphaerales bacterium]|nr:hypothetical protein [Phycisphaerales bacterium]MCB9841265.1 hypothetical protein [Phycisphaeraceae bacterium]
MATDAALAGENAGTPDSGDPACVAAAAGAVLEQCARFIQCLPEGCYARESRLIRGGTIGKHVRHTVDHFAAAVGGLDAGEPIDYDHRSREVPMETTPSVAIEAIGRLRDRLGSLDAPAMGRPVRIRVMVAGDGTEATLDSSLGRELHFAFHHAVHHHAMLKAIAGEFGVEAPSEFGIAPSTVNYQRTGA